MHFVPVDPATHSLPRSLSPSRAKDFQKCPGAYALKTIWKVPEPSSAAAAFGTEVHAVLEEMFELPAAERTLTWALEAWTQRVNGLDPTSILVEEMTSTGVLEKGKAMLENYFTQETPSGFDPTGVEVVVKGVLKTAYVFGKIDRLDVHPNTGGVEVCYVSDYKTGKAPLNADGSPNPWYEKEFWAMKIYAAMLRKHSQLTPHVLRLIYLAVPGKSGILRLRVTDAMLDKAAAEHEAIWQGINKAWKAGQFQCVKNVLCDWCSYKPICPVFGGTLDVPVTITPAQKQQEAPEGAS